jgi:hypothetical protein
VQSAPQALDSVRRALGALQQDVSQHPAVARAIEAVAGSLGLVHGLVQAGPEPAFAGTIPAGAPRAAAPQPAAQNFPAQPAARAPAQNFPAQPAARQPGPPSAQGRAQPAPPSAANMRAAAPAAVPAPQVAAAPPVQAGNLARVDAELGVHSATNFYKGLSGNDIVDSGGIFIATYQIPEIGRELLIHVTMPGGYEFQAKGVVRWTREAPLSSGAGLEAPPGFGAQFTEITPEGRQLVYRYVRNREPLFHDDL